MRVPNHRPAASPSLPTPKQTRLTRSSKPTVQVKCASQGWTGWWTWERVKRISDRFVELESGLLRGAIQSVNTKVKFPHDRKVIQIKN